MTERGPHLTVGQYTGRILILLGLFSLLFLLWRMRELVILVFGGVVVAVIFSLIARPLQRWVRLPRWAALLCAVLLVSGTVLTALWLFGGEIARQAATIRTELPEALRALRERLEPLGLERLLSGGDGQGVAGRIASLAVSVGSGIADTLLVLVAGIYLAAQPSLYRRGLLKLVPQGSRHKVADALDDSGVALGRWLIGQLIAMLIVGVLTGLGLWMLGVPAALTLGLIAALLDFVPTLGPILAAIPGILIAFTQSPQLALWTAGLYLVIQQLEGNLITPMLQQKAVDLPPALLLFALVAGGLIFGLAGILLAAPLTVVLLVMVKRLYVREGLDTATQLPTDED